MEGAAEWVAQHSEEMVEETLEDEWQGVISEKLVEGVVEEAFEEEAEGWMERVAHLLVADAVDTVGLSPAATSCHVIPASSPLGR